MTAQPASTRMAQEIAEAAVVVRALAGRLKPAVGRLADALRADPPSAVLTCARGSSENAAAFGRTLFEARLGVPAYPVAASNASVLGRLPLVSGSLVLLISQSGRSPDLLAVARSARLAGARTAAIVNDPGSPLAAAVDHVVPLDAGPEHSVAATKTYLATLAMLIGLAASWAGDGQLREHLDSAPEQLERAVAADWSPLVDGLRHADQGLYVVGRGFGLGTAREIALKLKEACRLPAEAFSAAELRHGPLALVRPGFPVLMFGHSDQTADGLAALARDLVGLGARVFAAGLATDGATLLPAPAAEPPIEAMVHAASAYVAIDRLAVTRGLDPDRPPNLSKVTETL